MKKDKKVLDEAKHNPLFRKVYKYRDWREIYFSNTYLTQVDNNKETSILRVANDINNQY